MNNSYIIVYVIVAIVIFVGFAFAIYSHAKKVGKNVVTGPVKTVEAKKNEPVLTKVLMTTNKGDILHNIKEV